MGMAEEAGVKKYVTSAAANLIHSLDALHLRFILRSLNSPFFPIHDSLLLDVGNIEGGKVVVRRTFGRIYNEGNLLQLIIESMYELNGIEITEELLNKIDNVSKGRPITPNKDLFRVR